MKHYETPEMGSIILNLVDVIKTSGEVESDGNPVDNVDGGGDQSW